MKLYQSEVRLTYQRCESVQFVIDKGTINSNIFIKNLVEF